MGRETYHRGMCDANDARSEPTWRVATDTPWPRELASSRLTLPGVHATKDQVSAGDRWRTAAAVTRAPLRQFSVHLRSSAVSAARGAADIHPPTFRARMCAWL